MHDSDALWSMVRVTNRMKEMTKRDMNFKFKLMPLEIIWSNESPQWKAMMALPALVSDELFQEALDGLVERKRNVRVPVEFCSVDQGLCAQTLHIGAYNQVGETLDRMGNELEAKGYRIKGDRREIYINQPFCNPPEKLQTIVRVPIESI
jgi:hypothetical protein